MKLINDYNKAVLETKRMWIEEKQKLEELKNAKNKRYWEYEDMIRKIQGEQSNCNFEFEKKEEKVKEEGTKERQAYNDTIKETGILFKLTDILKEGAKLPGNRFSDPKDLIESLYDDEFKKIGLFIRVNGKPVNCYSLCLEGESVFERVFPDTYMRKDLKSAAKKDILLRWWEKNKKNVMENWLKAQTVLEEKYKQVVELCKTDEWQKAYLRYRKDYYENSYSRGTSTEMYKAVLEQIRIFDTKPEDLPLLIGDIVTEDGMKALTEKLNGV